jgi:hypothetical protein
MIDKSRSIHLSSEFLGNSRDIKFLELSSLLQTITNNSINEEEKIESSSSSDTEVRDEEIRTTDNGINVLSLSLCKCFEA